MAAGTRMCASHLTASQGPNSSWMAQSHTYAAESATHTNTPFFIILCFGRVINRYNLDVRSDTHEAYGCIPFVHMITKAACNACWLQKQVVCSHTDKRENKGRKYWTCTEQNEWHDFVEDSRTSVVEKTCCLSGKRTDSQSRRVTKGAQFPFHNKKDSS